MTVRTGYVYRAGCEMHLHQGLPTLNERQEFSPP